jgi:hypothetical protein
MLDKIEKEYTNNKQLNHYAIIRVYDLLVTLKEAYIIMEACDNTLEKVIKSDLSKK